MKYEKMPLHSSLKSQVLQFKVAHIGIPDLEGFGELKEVFPGWEIAVIAYFNALGAEAIYEYDYGDGWLHTVKLEGYMFKEKGIPVLSVLNRNPLTSTC